MSLFNATTETASLRGQIQTTDIYILFSPVYTTLTFENSHTQICIPTYLYWRLEDMLNIKATKSACRKHLDSVIFQNKMFALFIFKIKLAVELYLYGLWTP